MCGKIVVVSGADARRRSGAKRQRPARSGDETGGSLRLLRPREAARRLGLSYPALKQWIYKGKLAAIKTAGGHYRIAEAELDKYLFRRIDRAPVAERRIQYRSISGRNQLVGRVTEVRLDGLLAQVEISIGGCTITSIITAEAVQAMRLRPGDTVAALIKATSVMIARSDRSRQG
jgi:molybdopterin-binding protein